MMKAEQRAEGVKRVGLSVLNTQLELALRALHLFARQPCLHLFARQP